MTSKKCMNTKHKINKNWLNKLLVRESFKDKMILLQAIKVKHMMMKKRIWRKITRRSHLRRSRKRRATPNMTSRIDTASEDGRLNSSSTSFSTGGHTLISWRLEVIFSTGSLSCTSPCTTMFHSLCSSTLQALPNFTFKWFRASKSTPKLSWRSMDNNLR